MYIRGGWEGCGDGWVVAKAKTKKQDGIMAEFRVAMVSTCTHKGSVFHYTELRPRQMCADSGSHIGSPLQNWSPPLVPFHQLWIYMVKRKHSR